MDREEIVTTSFERILFCTDFSANADFAFRYAVDAATRRPGSTLYLLHVIPETESQFWKSYISELDGLDDKAKRDIDERVDKAYVSRLPAGLAMETAFRIGKDYQEILDFARSNEIDLIVIGRRGHGTLSKALFGKVTEKIVRKSHCAVLIIPLDYQKRQEKG
jgi:nucleotide-binding universal stress UspA family protein